MGVYDREYMVGTDESMHAGGRRYTALVILVIVNVLVWIAWQFVRSDPATFLFMHDNFTVSRTGVLRDLRIYTLLTSCISHEALGHIFFNMLFFWVLGDEVERIYGFRNFLWLYACCGIAASLAFVGVEAVQAQDSPMLGASGAIMGIAVVAAIFNPSRPISIWGLVTVPLRVLVIVYIVFDILGALDNRSIVAHS
ncbi:MAG: rhomboid family intramembrane serine protease, partial [Planctomycetota bacterium]|nr:rhomboid family intramembrane serine protease [Planctomycetota bacterium]